MLRQDEIKQLIIENSRRLQKLKEHQARKGIDTPPHVLTEIEDIEAKLAELQSKLTALPDIARKNPYRGLSAFREQDADVFFGRDIFTANLVEKVRQKRMVAVLGPSGSGKSSVVFAGLIPTLREEKNQWLITSLRPGSDPFLALATVLLPLYETDLDKTDQMVKTPKLAKYLDEGDLPLSQVILNIFEAQSEVKHFLLIVDQFEELYTLTQESKIRHRFLDLLLAVIDTNGNPQPNQFHLIITLRADFLSQALLYPSFGDALQNAIELLRSMNADDLRMAIEKPADLQGVIYEPGLVGTIINDIENEPGNLPLLEFALTALWEKQTNGELTHSAYKTIGRVEGALSRHADQVFEGLTEAEQEQARRVFIQMVHPGEGTEDTRRLATKAELGETTWKLVQQLADERLVVTDQDPQEQETVEVVHEALIRGWSRLTAWMKEDRRFRTWQDRLRAVERQWQTSQQDNGALLRGAPLAEAEVWLNKRREDLSQTEQNFINVSLQQQKHQEQRRRITFFGAIIAATVMAVLAIWAVNRTQAANEAIGELESALTEAQIQSRISLAEALASIAPNLADEQIGEPELAHLLAVEAVRINPPEGRNIQWLLDRGLREVLGAKAVLHIFLHNDEVTDIAISPDGQILVSTSMDRNVRLWDIETGELIQTLTGHVDGVTAVAFSPDARSFATASLDGTIRLWDLMTGDELIVFSGHTGYVRDVAFSPDGANIATASDDQTARIWDPFSGTLIATLIGHTNTVLAVSFSPDGKFLTTASADGTISVWDASDLTLSPIIITSGDTFITSASFSPDGKILATSGDDNVIRLWDTDNLSTQAKILKCHLGWVTSVAFSPDGQSLASASRDSSICIWDLTAPSAPPATFTGHTGDVNSVAFTPDARMLASASWDNTVRLWIADIDMLAELACQQVNRNLSSDEWNLYLPDVKYHKTCPDLANE